MIGYIWTEYVEYEGTYLPPQPLTVYTTSTEAEEAGRAVAEPWAEVQVVAVRLP